MSAVESDAGWIVRHERTVIDGQVQYVEVRRRRVAHTHNAAAYELYAALQADLAEEQASELATLREEIRTLKRTLVLLATSAMGYRPDPDNKGRWLQDDIWLRIGGISLDMVNALLAPHDLGFTGVDAS